MPEPTQLTVYGTSEPLTLPDERDCSGQAVFCRNAAQDACEKPRPLFTAPQTMRGQLAMPTDTVQR